jgi:predicted nucleic acid-binding protein
VRQAADTSITIAALVADHEARDLAEDALKQCTTTIAHVAIETYSVLTRFPPPRRLTSADAAALIDARLPATYAALDASRYAKAPTRLAPAGISGGATYDGLIALTALEHDLELVTRDRRAERTYRALEVPYRLLR